MSNLSDITDALDDRTKQTNFSEEVTVLKESSISTDSTQSNYTVKNKNNTRIYNVLGRAGIKPGNQAVLGNTEGDAARPILIGGGVAVNKTSSDADDPGWPPVAVAPLEEFTIRLSIETDTEAGTLEKPDYIKVAV
jgi:hypothetical protein